MTVKDLVSHLVSNDYSITVNYWTIKDGDLDKCIFDQHLSIPVFRDKYGSRSVNYITIDNGSLIVGLDFIEAPTR